MKSLITILAVFISLTAVTAALAITDVTAAPMPEPLLLIIAGTGFLILGLLGLLTRKAGSERMKK